MQLCFYKTQGIHNLMIKNKRNKIIHSLMKLILIKITLLMLLEKIKILFHLINHIN